jgi:hypothetical protein
MIRLLEKVARLTSEDLVIILSIISIILLIWSMYTNIKLLCLKKASEMVAKVEKKTDLSGEEKFALCILWINEDLPKLFRNSLFKSIISKLVDFVYNNSFNYMRNYIKRKTGYDINELIEQMKESANKEND